MIEDKVSLARTRAELVERLAAQLPPAERVHLQGELSIVNAKIKAQNTLEAAQLKAAADRRKVAGLAEAEANAARASARARAQGLPGDDGDGDEDDDPGQTAAIEAWVDAVLLHHDVGFTRSRAGKRTLNVDPEWAPVLEALINGVRAAARGQELPDLPRAPKASPLKPPKKKPKKG